MAPRYYLRNPNTAIVSHTTHYLLVQPFRDPVFIDASEGVALKTLLQTTSTPTTKEQLLLLAAPESIDFLLECGALLEGTLEELQPPRPEIKKVCRHLVFGVSGSVSAGAALPLALQLAQTFCEQLDVVFTAAAQKFVRPEMLQYRGLRTWTDAFAPKGEINVPHIHLANSAEMVLILPASANTIAKLATGACSDLLSLVVSATKAPVVIVPAMNLAMLTNPAIARNIEQLRQDGMYVIEPSLGVPASKGPHGLPEIGALGVNEFNITATLEAILVAHRLPPETEE